MAVTAAYPLLPALAGRADSVAVLVSLSALAYVLGIYVVVTVARAVVRGQGLPVLLTAAVAGIAAALISHPALLYQTIMTCLTVTCSGALLGWKARQEDRQLSLYLWGLAVAGLGAILTTAPVWSMLAEGFRSQMPDQVRQLGQMLSAGGASAAETQDLIERFRTVVDMILWILPAVTVLNLMMQYSIGFLWFLGRRVQTEVRCGRLRPFAEWRMPFAMTPVLIVVILARLAGNEAVRQVADNLLLGLSLYYCVTGLSFVEWVFARVKLPLFAKVLFYVMLTLTNVMGYFALVLAGFIDSFANWRKLSPKEQST
jgi:hypothetical protein